MQLSTSVLPSDPSISASLPPGMPPGVPGNAADAMLGTVPSETPAAFAEFLPTVDAAPVALPKKPAETLTTSANEGVAAIWAGWLAATAPTPIPPTQVAAWDAASASPISADSGVDSAEEGETPWIGKGGVPSAPLVTTAPGKECRPDFDDLPVAVDSPAAGFAPSVAPRQNVPISVAVAGAVAPEAEWANVPVSSTTGPLPVVPVPVDAVTPAASGSSTPVAAVPNESVAAVATPPESPRRLEDLRPASREIRAAFGPTMRREKIADEAEQILPLRFRSLEDAEKKILNVKPEQVTKGDDPLGIGIAMPGRTMFTNLFTHSTPGTTLVAATVQPAITTASAPVPSAEMASQAHRAVNVILTVAERATAASRPSVHLQFAVGGADLSIRVELRAGEVHTTFRTDSGELRTALAAAWQSLDAETNRGLRLADAVFAPATAAGTGTSLGDGASAQRDSGSRQTADVFHPAASRPAFSRAEPETAAPDYREAALLPNLNLYTFA